MPTSQAQPSSDAPPAYQGTTGAVNQPIGVPYYILDPNTGQPMVGPDGQPLRWGAQISSPKELQTFGHGGTKTSATQTSTSYQLPRYFDGDQWLPAQLPPDQLAALQRKMVAAGLLKTGEAQLGVWDQTSMTGYTRLLAYANASGLDVASALDRWGQQAQANPGAGRAPLQIRTSNPDDLKAVFRKSIISELGQGWSDQQLNQMVSAYQSLETQSQTQAYNQADTGGTVIQPPDPSTYAVTQAKSQDTAGVQAHDALGYQNEFFAMLKGIAS